ncbi:hypothetical protein F2Q68_00045790 [Brassica cretica]|uniref:Uncharacterized protein n=1 Tax=Brassica cretica TaxID=69181 RepID=A0A8S9LJH4_BRACR|nr:hypothetical protein F2Q68_00045790 [Brassica cretica]
MSFLWGWDFSPLSSSRVSIEVVGALNLLICCDVRYSPHLRMMNFLPSGKIYPVRFWWECGSCTSPPSLQENRGILMAEIV